MGYSSQVSERLHLVSYVSNIETCRFWAVVDDLRFHTWGNFTSFSYAPPPLGPQDPNSSLEDRIPAEGPNSRPVSSPQGPNPSLRPKFQPQSPNPSLKAQIPVSRPKFPASRPKFQLKRPNPSIKQKLKPHGPDPSCKA